MNLDEFLKELSRHATTLSRLVRGSDPELARAAVEAARAALLRTCRAFALERGFCVMPAGHDGDHADSLGRTFPNRRASVPH